ncbi:MAG: hypothetical protein JWO09_1232 [Bacteroidetes bacterium]|nr:hypothetical protein [Bacteroidota bacterium]
MDVLCHKLYVKLDRDSAIDSPWNTLYSYEYYFKFKKTVTISVGTKEKILSGCAEIDIKTTESWMIEIGCALILGLLVLVFQMSKKLLKGGVPPILNQDYVLLYKKKKDHEPLATNEIYFSDLPYSLSRAQLLFWNLVVVISIIYIWMFTDELVSPTGTVLIIIGISGGTNLIGKIIDNDKVRRQSDQSTTSQVPVTAADFYTKGYQSRGFLTDILSDENGISIHRFQLVMFTIVFGIYFLWYMIYNLAMPQFNDTLLLLMGISSTTYAGVKITEK